MAAEPVSLRPEQPPHRQIRRGSAPGNPAVVLQGIPGVDGGHAAVVNGRRFNSVFDIYISDAQGGKQMGILGIHSRPPHHAPFG